MRRCAQALVRAAPWGTPLAALALALALRVLLPDAFERLQLPVFDFYQRLAPRPFADAPVRVVDIDEESLARVGQWPWSRARVAELVDRLAEAGVASIAFDAVFAEPDRTAPARLAASLGSSLPAAASDALRSLPDPDALFATAIASAPVVLGVAASETPGRAGLRARAGIAFGGEDPAPWLPQLAGAVTNLPALEDAAAGLGSFAIVPDGDGVHRRVPLLVRHGEVVLPSLAVEALRVATGSSTLLVRMSDASGEGSFGARTGVVALRIGPDLVVPTDSAGRLWIHETLRAPTRSVPAWRVLAGEVDAAQLEGCIVFVGTSAAGLRDLRATPLDPVAPGVLLHAQAAEQILLGHVLVRPDFAPGAEFVFTAGLGLGLVVLLRRAGALASLALLIAAVGASVTLSWHAFSRSHTLFDPVTPAATALLVHGAGALAGWLRSETERRRVAHAFGRYLAPALVERLAASPERLRLGGESREMSFLFCDVRGFTAIAESLPPEALTALVNRLLTPLGAAVLARGGTVDKYMGDCVMAFWNAPLDDAEHARHACEAALAMRDALARMNAGVAHEGPRELAGAGLRVGIGINTGRCVVGNFGTEQRFDYSVIGDAVNLASRLEGRSKVYGATIVAAETTRCAAPDLAWLALDRVRVKGRREPVDVHALVGDAQLAKRSRFRALAAKFDAALERCRACDFDAARALVDDALHESQSLAPRIVVELHAIAEHLLARIEALRAAPPAPGWDGVTTALDK